MDIYNNRKVVLISFAFIAAASLFCLTRLNFVFDFERFFPKGDPDLEYFETFKKEFEDDDNFLLVAFTDSTSVFNEQLLTKLHKFTVESSKLPAVKTVQSLTNFKYFVKLPIGGFSPPYPAIHLDDFSRLSADSLKIMEDERLVGNLISEDTKATMVLIKHVNGIQSKQADSLITGVQNLLLEFDEGSFHLLGRANFQTVLIEQQIKEFVFSTFISAILVLIVFFILLRKVIGVSIALASMLLCLLIFLGIIGLFRIEMDVLSTMFPIIMIIVGVSDVVHLTTKYIDEYEKLQSREAAIKVTVREIGMATFLTSFTTAIGFATLLTSNIPPVKTFGVTAALGVIVAYVTVIFFTTALLAYFPAEKVSMLNEQRASWKKAMQSLYYWGKKNSRIIIAGLIIYCAFTAYGISKITTDIKIYETLPKGITVTEDFRFFEEKFAGFRPYEIAVEAKGDNTVTDYELLSDLNKVEEFVKQYEEINGIVSFTAIYKTLNRAYNGDRASAYSFPPTERKFNDMKKYVDKMPFSAANVLVNKENTIARISGKVKDVGSERINQISAEIEDFISKETNLDIATYTITGTGVIFDKNNEYLRTSLLYGLGIAFLAISIIMSILFRDIKMVIISLIPNIFPLLFGGALMGYFGIALDAPTAIIFAISFGIAVDDTIHFLSKLKIELNKGLNVETALHNTFVETGKAIIITTIILFFGFLILFFSKTPGIVSVGLLVSGTLFTAVISDLALIPLLARWFLKK